MMKRFLICLVASVFLATCSMNTYADPKFRGSTEELEDERAAASEMYDDEEYASRDFPQNAYGEVTTVNAPSNTLIIQEKDKFNKAARLVDARTMVFVIEKSTTFKGGRSLEDIGTGDMVTVDYFTMNNRNMATNVIFEEQAESGVVGSSAVGDGVSDAVKQADQEMMKTLSD